MDEFLIPSSMPKLLQGFLFVILFIHLFLIFTAKGYVLGKKEKERKRKKKKEEQESIHEK